MSSTNSMHPTISKDSTIKEVKKLEKYSPGDIILFKQKEKIIAHRLIYIHPTKDFYLTKGDNNKKTDPPITKKQILGKVISLEKNGKTLTLRHIYLAQSITYQKQTEKIAKLFQKHSLPFIILKGHPVWLHYTGKLPNRLYFDIDLLIHPKHLQKASSLLTSLNFQKQQPQKLSSSTPTQLNFLKKTIPHPTIIDLHTQPAIAFTKVPHFNQLLPLKSQLTKTLWQNSIQTTINNQKLPILNLETLILFLFLHLYHHNFQGTHRYDLIHQIIKKNSPDWNKIAQTSQKLKLSNFLTPSLLLLQKHYHPTEGLTPSIALETLQPTTLTTQFSTKIINKSQKPWQSSSPTHSRFKRLLLLLLLSPKPFTQKLKTLLSPKSFQTIYLSIKSLLSSSSKNSSTSSSASSSET